jgi:hypothetical protein
MGGTQHQPRPHTSDIRVPSGVRLGRLSLDAALPTDKD